MAVPDRGRRWRGRGSRCRRSDATVCAGCPGGGSSIALGLGVLYLGNSGTYYAGLETVSASLAALIVFIYPAIVAVLSLRVGHRLVGRRPWVALAMALAGTALALGGIPAGAVPPLAGLLAVVASPIIYSVWIVLSARLAGETTERVGGEADDGADTAAATALMMVATAIGFWALAIVTRRPLAAGRAAERRLAGDPRHRRSSRPSSRSRRSTPGPAGSGRRRRRSSQRSSRSGRSPWRRLLFGETLGPLQLVGGALVIGGVILAQTAPTTVRPEVTLRVADE